jgi:hypothetical protein
MRFLWVQCVVRVARASPLPDPLAVAPSHPALLPLGVSAPPPSKMHRVARAHAAFPGAPSSTPTWSPTPATPCGPVPACAVAWAGSPEALYRGSSCGLAAGSPAAKPPGSLGGAVVSSPGSGGFGSAPAVRTSGREKKPRRW